MTFCTIIKEYQTLIVGALGFLGVMSTLWFNAKQIREQRQDELRHDTETLRVALLAELKINQNSLTENLEGLRAAREGQGCHVPTHSMDDAYRAFTHRIGLLSETEVHKVMYAFLALRTYRAKLFLVGSPSEQHDGNILSERHVNVPPNNVVMLTALIESLIPPIDEAIEAMEDAQGAD